MQFFQQFAGINTVMYYSAKIITMAGVSSKSLAIWLSAAVASMNFVWTIPGMLLVERVGRRKLLLVSLMGEKTNPFQPVMGLLRISTYSVPGLLQEWSRPALFYSME